MTDAIVLIILLAVVALDWAVRRNHVRRFRRLEDRVMALEEINHDLGVKLLEEEGKPTPLPGPVIAPPVLAPPISRAEAASNWAVRNEEERRRRDLDPEQYPDSSL